MSTSAPPAGRAVEVARSVLRASLGDRVRLAGPDRLEALAQDNTPLVQQANVEPVGGVLRVLDVEAPVVAAFEGFLDGIQRSATVAYLDGVPLLHGTAAAAIRERDFEGRMATWLRPAVDHAVYGSRALIGDATWAALCDILDTRGHLLRDTDDDLPVPSRHPSALLRQALDGLSRVRNDLERDMGEAWCSAHPSRALYVDGSLRSSRAMLRSTGVVGVVKSHATLYLPDDALPLVTSLASGQRTSCITAFGGDGNPHFLTWYLRLRSASGHDPFFGLVRVETGAREMDAAAAEGHADRVSRWLLAERAPLARPDSRWDVMPYAIRDCEVYLRAVA
ncbi:MAG: hypothetical protein IT355_10705 [Gemmatimonadaceae bacterium]|nr:hypothetical protein [Gemmatimonadaceae bacterium]